MKKSKKASSVTFPNVKKKRKDKTLNAKMVSRKKANTIVVGVFMLICITVAVGAIRSLTQVARIDDLEAELIVIRQENRQVARDDGFDVVLVTRVMNEFVPLFMNVNFESQDGVNERLEQLSRFVSFDVRNLNDGIDRNEARILDEFELISISQYGSFNLASYLVSYRVEDVQQIFNEDTDADEGEETDDEAENEDYEGDHEIDGGFEDEEDDRISMVLHIPFVTQNGLVSIISMPYFLAETTALGHTAPFKIMEENDTRNEMSHARRSIENFLPVFFEMYAGSNERDLELFMQDVVLMGGRFELDRVDIFSARYDFVGDHVLVQVSVTFRDVGTGFVHEVPFTLLLEQQANSWFVLEMHHLFIR